MIGKYFIAVAVVLVCLANFATVADAAYTFGTHTSSDCSNSSMIGWSQGWDSCASDKKRSTDQFICYQASDGKQLWYSFIECTIANEAPVSSPPAGWKTIVYSQSSNCDFKSANTTTAVAVNTTGSLVNLFVHHYGIADGVFNITMTCQNGLLSASACDDYLNTCFSLNNVAANQCVNATSSGVSNSWSGMQMGCQAPAPVAAPVTSSGPAANTPAKKTNSATVSVATSILTVGLVVSSYLFA